MAVAVCLPISPPLATPQLSIPQFGVLQAARQSLYDLPDASYFIMRMQEASSLALAPLRRFIEMLEIVFALKNCSTAVIDAISQFSVQPILDCIPNLVKALAKLVSFIPPLSYIPTLLDLATYVIQCIDEFFNLLIYLDSRISDQKALLNTAIDLGDLELANYADCAASDLIAQMSNATDLLIFVSGILQLLLEPVVQAIGEPVLRALLGQLVAKATNLPQLLNDLQTSLSPETSFDIPGLGDLIEEVIGLRNIVVQLYNAVAPLIGREASLSIIPQPSFDNF